MSSSKAPPELPAVIDRYQVRAYLGGGAFGTVYRAFDPRLDREVALKVLRPEMTASEQAVERFLREAKAAAKLFYPHIVPVYDAGRAGKEFYIASAFIQGQTLAAAIPEGGMEVHRAVEMAVQLALALGYAHRQGVLHRDVKPQNVMVDELGSLYLMDFGLAAWVQEEGTRLTQEGAMMGTPAYMSPEQASGERDSIGPAADLYSAGVVLYELLTGRKPFEGHPAALVYQIVHKAVAPPSQHRAGLPALLDAICLKALAKAPAERYRSGEDMAAVLRSMSQSSTQRDAVPPAAGPRMPLQNATLAPTTLDSMSQATPDPAATPADTVLPRGRSRLPWMLSILAAVTLLVVLAGVVVMFALRRPTGEAPKEPPVVHSDDPPSPVAPPPGKELPPQKVIREAGKVVGVDKDKLTVRGDDGEKTVAIPAKARVRIDGKDGVLADVRKNSAVTVTSQDDVVVAVDAASPPPPAPVKAPVDAAEVKRAQQDWADYLGVPVEQDINVGGGVTMKLRLIPPGRFMMGSPKEEKDRFDDEGPQHEVEISQPFYIGVYPVTKAQFAAFAASKPYKTDGENAGDKRTWRDPAFRGYSQSDNDPVVWVSWNDAQAFCAWLKKPDGWTCELPREAEWEYACRAGTGTAYFFGDDPRALGDYAWYGDNSGGHTCPVGGKKANPWGLYDMGGNVWQWCADGYGPYQEAYIKDPKGNDSSNVRVLRGGSWDFEPKYCRAADRLNHAPANRSHAFGLRVVLRPAPWTP